MRLVGLGNGRFQMLDGASAAEIRRRPDFVDRAPSPQSSRSKPTLMAQAALRAQERRRDERRTAEDFGLGQPAYQPARVIDFVADECRWPLDGGLACGARQAAGPGQPYCARHRALSKGSG